MKILLINPPDPEHVRHGMEPCGIMYLQATLKSHGFDETKLIDAFDYSWSQVETEVKCCSPDVVGIPCWTISRSNSIKLAQLCRSILPEVKIIFGGAHATFFPQHLLPYGDVVVLGEAEETIVDLMRNWGNLNKVEGIVTKTIRTKQRKPIENLDSIPFPDRTDIDQKRYTYDLGRYGMHGSTCGMITSRGCAWGCSFCSTTHFWGRKWRARSPKNVVDEFESLFKKGIRYVNILDDIFTLDSQRTINICKMLIELNINIKWYCETRVDCVNAEMLSWMKKAGCFAIFYGVESGSDKILKNIKKGFNTEQIQQAFKLTWAAGIYPEAMLMVGNSGETAETVQETIKLILKIHPYSPSSASDTMVFPNTPLYDYIKSRNLITDDYWLSNKGVPSFTTEHSEEELAIYRFRLTSAILKDRNKMKYTIFVFKKVLRTMSKPKLFIRVIKNLWSS